MSLTATYERDRTRWKVLARSSHPVSIDAYDPEVVELAHGIKAKTVTAEDVPPRLRTPVQEYLLVLYERRAKASGRG